MRKPTRARGARTKGQARALSRAALLTLFLLCPAFAAQGGHTLFGDLHVDGARDDGRKPIAFTISLHTEDGIVTERQAVSDGGRYRFLNLPNGVYYLVVEAEGVELARIRAEVQSPYKNDFRQDIQLQMSAGRPAPPVVVAAEDFYKRKPAGQKLYDRAGRALTERKYADAAALFAQVVAADPQDYQAWTELGTARLFQGDADEAERDYLRAAGAMPTYAPALLNLGRLRVMRKKFDGAVEVLTKAVTLKPPSADVNFLLGEAYLQLKKGSKAVPHLEEAARLGRADAHLRLATLYNAVGLKERAAAEYEQYLSKKPDAPERKRLEEYIKENRKR